MAALSYENVGWFQISVGNSIFVHVLEGEQDLGDHKLDDSQGQPVTGHVFEHLGEVSTFGQLAEEVDVVLVLELVLEFDDVGVGEV